MKSWTTSASQSIFWPPGRRSISRISSATVSSACGLASPTTQCFSGSTSSSAFIADSGLISASLAQALATRSGLRLMNSMPSARAFSVFCTSDRFFSSTPGPVITTVERNSGT